MDNTSLIEKIAELNPCVKFIIDNYDMLCCAHGGKVVMVMNSNEYYVRLVNGPAAYVARIFDSMIEAMRYTHAMNMGHVPYALKECDGDDVMRGLTWSIGCKKEA